MRGALPLLLLAGCGAGAPASEAERARALEERADAISNEAALDVDGAVNELGPVELWSPDEGDRTAPP